MIQPHSIDVYRPTFRQGTTLEIEGYALVYEGVPCFIQPADSKEEFYFQQRGIEDVHNVYTVATGLTFKRNDVLKFRDAQLHVLGIKNGCQLDVYIQLTCYAYPEDAKKRLDTEDYE